MVICFWRIGVSRGNSGDSAEILFQSFVQTIVSGLWSSPLLLPRRSMSSANLRLHLGLPQMAMDVWWSWIVSCMIFSRNRSNRMGESKHPWRTPIIVWKNSPIWLLKRTTLLDFSYSAWMAWISPSFVLKLLRTCDTPECQTLSNACLKSMKLWNRSSWCFSTTTRLLKICYTVLGPGLKPACSLPVVPQPWSQVSWG